MRELMQYALDIVRSKGADYADIRYRATNNEQVFTQDDVLAHYGHDEDIGIGIRVLKNGRWGFSSTPILTKESIHATCEDAINIAQSTTGINQFPIILTKDTPIQGKFSTKVEKDPFKVSLEDKVNLLYKINEITSANQLIRKTIGYLYFRKFNQIFLSTEGADLENDICMSSAMFEVTSVDKGDFQSRRYQEFPKTVGWEWIEEQDLLSHAERVAEEAVIKLRAPKAPAGKKDLILLPSHLVLTIHESVGHPTELDRALGWEANFAGTSFATTDKRGNFQYGSELVNFRADNSLPQGLATWGWDDDGVQGKSWDIVRNGVFANYGTTRDVAHYIGDNESMGCNRADSYSSQPINRIPNLSLMPGEDKMSLDDLIADTNDGILIDGRGSFSIDQRRYNFQFGGDFFHEIKNGKIVGPLRDVTYQAITPHFWKSMDAICDKSEWIPYGVMNCGKGEPMQVAQMTHGSAPARFRNIDVGGALNG